MQTGTGIYSGALRKYTNGYQNKIGKKAPMGKMIKGLWKSSDYKMKDFIQVNLNKCYNDVMRFYKNTSMKEDEAIFTYNNIPPECLTKLNKIDFLK